MCLFIIWMKKQPNFLNNKSNKLNIYCIYITPLLFSAAVQVNQLCRVHSALISVPENSLRRHHAIFLMSGGKKLQRKSFHIQCGHQSSRSAGTVLKCYNMLKLLKSGRQMRRNRQKRRASGKQMPAQTSRDISTLQIS